MIWNIYKLLISALFLISKEWRYPLCPATDVEHSFPNSSHVFCAMCLCHSSIKRYPILFPFRSAKTSWLALTNQKQQQWLWANFRAALEKMTSQWQQAHIAPRFLFLKTITTESNHSILNFRFRQWRYQFFFWVIPHCLKSRMNSKEKYVKRRQEAGKDFH